MSGLRYDNGAKIRASRRPLREINHFPFKNIAHVWGVAFVMHKQKISLKICSGPGKEILVQDATAMLLVASAIHHHL